MLNAHTLRFLELAANKQDCLQRSKQNLHNYYRQWIIHLWLFSDRHAIAHKSDLPMGTTLQTWTAFSADPLHVAQNRIRGQSLYTLHPPEHCVPTCLRAYVPTCLRAYVLQSTVPTCLQTLNSPHAVLHKGQLSSLPSDLVWWSAQILCTKGIHTIR